MDKVHEAQNGHGDCDSNKSGLIIIFPFMAKGHTIPLIHLANHLTSRHSTTLRITFITTPANTPFLSLLSSICLTTLPFITTHSQLPPGCKSTDTLPSIALRTTFISAAASAIRIPFEALLTNHVYGHFHPPPLCLISDFFLGWTLLISRRLSLPRIVFHGMSAFSMSICKSLFSVDKLHGQISGQPFHLPGMPDSLLMEIGEVPEFFFKQPEDVEIENGVSDVESWGVLVNSYEELEGEYAHLFESFYRPSGSRAWLVGPLCMLGDTKNDDVAGDCMRWLDEQDGRGGPWADPVRVQVLVGSAAWQKGWWSPLLDLNGAGKIVGLAPQREVLRHRAMGGFLSHCRWNSVMEAVAVVAGVPVLAWPLIGERGLNATFVVEELNIGVRIALSVSRERVEEGVREVMMVRNKALRERVGELSRKAEEVVADGESSQRRLEEMIQELIKIARCRSSTHLRDKHDNDNDVDVEEGEGVGYFIGQITEIYLKKENFAKIYLLSTYLSKSTSDMPRRMKPGLATPVSFT